MLCLGWEKHSKLKCCKRFLSMLLLHTYTHTHMSTYTVKLLVKKHCSKHTDRQTDRQTYNFFQTHDHLSRVTWCMYVCMCACVCMYVCGGVYLWEGQRLMHLAAYEIPHVYPCIHTEIHAYTYICMYLYIHTYTYIYIYACIYVCTHEQKTLPKSFKSIHTYIYTQ